MARSKVTKARLVDALNQAHGLKTGAAEILGVVWNTVQAACERYPEESQLVIDHWRKRRTERALYKLDEAIDRGENWAIALQLKDSKGGRAEGYGNAVDITSGGEPVRLIVEYEEKAHHDVGLQDTAAEAAPEAE